MNEIQAHALAASQFLDEEFPGDAIMNSQFFEKIGVELPDGSPMVDSTRLTKGQHYFVGPDKSIFIFKGNTRRERKISEIAFRKAGGKIA